MWKFTCILALACASSAAQVILPTLPCGQAATFYSLNANTPTSVEFVNTTAQSVMVYWLDYNGVRELYHTLNPGESYTQGTFYTHPWVITNLNDACIAAYQPAATPGIARISVSGIVLTQTGFTFQAVQGGPIPPANTFKVLDGSTGSLDLSVSASTVSGGSWLSVSPASSTVFSVNPPPIFTVTADPSGLAPGDYYGRIQVDSQAAANAPQFLSIVLNVSSSGAALAPSVQPSGLTFVAPSARSNPNAQVIHMAAIANRPSPFTVSVTTASGGSWLGVTPMAGLLSPGQPLDLQVSAVTNQLPSTGSDQGSIVIAFPQDNIVEPVNVVFVTTPSPNSSVTGASVPSAAAAAACTPSKLLPAFTLLGSNFVAPAAWPAAIEVSVTDDCGSPLLNGAVGVSFSNGDPPLSLLSQLNGSWSGTWAPNNTRAGASVTATATQAATNLKAIVTLDGSVAANAQVPQLNPGGVVSAASFSANAAPSPGEIVSIFGQNMADGVNISATLPLNTQLSGASLLIAGRLLPLVFTSTGQINAVMPFGVPSGAIYQMVLQRGTKLSVPQTVTVTPAEPGVFTTDGSGKGQGHIYKFPAPTQQILADASNPATTGDVIVIYCSGLGAVSPPVADGAATPSDTLRQTVKPVSLTIGGISASVGFAGLTPGFSGLYQVNATVPSGIQPGLQVPVILTASSLSSAPVTMALH